MTFERVFVDANVLFPVRVADLVLSCAEYGLFELVWSEDLLGEIERVLVDTKGLPPQNAATFCAQIRVTFPAGRIETSRYQTIVPALSGPDDTDLVHVAAAIAGGVDVIVTNNLRDFAGVTAPDGTTVPQALTPDTFFTRLAEELPEDLVAITRGMARRLTRPPITWETLLGLLSKAGLSGFVGVLRRAT